jgi:hypothetical protein
MGQDGRESPDGKGRIDEMATETLTEEFKQLKCERCGKTFEIPIEDTKERNYSKRCDTCQVSKTRAMDEPGRKKTEVCSGPGRITSKDRKCFPATKEECYEPMDLFDGIQIEAPAGLSAPVAQLIRSGAEALVARLKPKYDLPDEEIKEAVGRLLSRRSIRELESLLAERRTSRVVSIIDVRKSGEHRQAEAERVRQEGLSSALKSLQDAGKVSVEAVRCFVEVRDKGRSLRDVAATEGIGKTTVSRMVDEVTLALRKLGPSDEIAWLLEEYLDTPIAKDEDEELDKDYPRPVERVGWIEREEVRETRDKFAKHLDQGDLSLPFDRPGKGFGRSDRSTTPLFDDYDDESCP